MHEARSPTWSSPKLDLATSQPAVRVSSFAMAEAVGLAASVIAIINLSAKVANLCLQYSTAVGNARADITCLRTRLDHLGTSLQGVQHLLDGRNNQELVTSRKLVDSLNGCTSELAQLQSRLDPGKARKAMRRFGLRALKWPFDSKEVSGIVSNLEHYKQTIMLCLQVDQTTLLLGIGQRIEGMSLQLEGSASIARKPCFSVPFDQDPEFVDRPDVMAWIKKQYTGSAGRMALVGMGGFGKSQVAIQFAHHIHDTSPQTSVFWVHASSRPRFEEAYRSIAETLQLPRRNDPNVNVLRLVCDWLQTEEASSWVMVLDNADDVNLFYPSSNVGGNKAGCCPADGNPAARSEQRPLAAFLPKRHNGTILITSRSMDAAEKLTGSHKAVYRISTMDAAQGLQLLRNKLKGDFDKDSAADLLLALDYIPLAITQAAAYINRRAPRVSVRTYLETMQKSDKKKGSLLNSDAGDLRRDETVSNSVVTTWQVTFEQIRRERPSAAHLLFFMSFFNPQGVPEFVLHNYDTDLTDNVDMDAESDDFEDDLDVLRGYSLVSMTATRDVCNYGAAEKLGGKAIEIRTKALGKEHPDTLTSMAGLALTYWEQGRWKEAEKLQVEVIEMRKRVLGEEHPDTLSSMAGLALTYWEQGRWKEAEKLQVEVIKMRKRVLGKEHPDILASMGNLALKYCDQGRWKEAEELEVGVMEMRKRVLGEEHPDTLTSMGNLASTYRNQGRWKEAEELEVGVMETRKRVLGKEHPDMLSSMANLALTYWEQGRWKEAEKLQVEVIEIRKRVLGKEHPDILTSMGNLALIYSDQGRWKEAEQLEVEVMETRKRVLGEEHPDTLSSMHNLAFAWKDQGRTGDALALLRNCVVLRKRILGVDHPKAASSAATLAKWENVSALS
ncbi:hypothetical protein DL770_008416 [Monosporascus sp. CRB-9-2]|nr:hypothetical protein DL770_008416 [Monosporascus sp. CRB-9-2]